MTLQKNEKIYILFKFYEIKYGGKCVLLFWTYIDNTHREDFQPSLVGNDRRVDEMMSHIVHYFHKVLSIDMDLSIGFQCMHYCQHNQCHADILPF